MHIFTQSLHIGVSGEIRNQKSEYKYIKDKSKFNYIVWGSVV